MKNNSSSNEFYKPQECPYLEEAAWRDEFLLTEVTYNHLVAIISINSISVLPTVLLKALVIFAVVTRKRSNLERVSTLSLIWHKFATLTHLVLITVDRYIAIKKPLRYRDIVTTRRVTVAVLSVWTYIFVVISEVILSGVKSGADMYNIYLTIWDLVLLSVTSISIFPS